MSATPEDSPLQTEQSQPQPLADDPDPTPPKSQSNDADSILHEPDHQSIPSDEAQLTHPNLPEPTDRTPNSIDADNLDDPTHQAAHSSGPDKLDEPTDHTPNSKDADKLDEPTDHAPHPTVAENGSLPQEVKNPELRKDQGSRTFTMRELLRELKSDENEDSESERRETNSPSGQEHVQQQQHIDHSNAAMDLINSVTGADDEGRSRQRILTFAARRYASAIERNPGDYDALYNWALVLQESADNVSSDSNSPSKDALLEEACKKYDETTRLNPALHDAYYNWAIAISDRAKMRGRTKEAEELWKQATKNYEKAVQLNWNSPQALNNWGLALQELSSIVPAREKQTIVKTAISKFRAAIRLQFDFHRAIYNLGTVLYGLAEDTTRIGGAVNAKEVSSNELYSQSAIYIAAAHALKPNYSVYGSALKLVRSMLPLPHLKVGYLTAHPVGNPLAPHNDWKRTQFVLNHEGLQQLNKVEQKQITGSLYSESGDMLNTNRRAIKVDVPGILSVSVCADLTLPPGAGLCIETIHGSVFLIADSWESLDGWFDAIRLVYTIFARRKSDVLAGIITG